MENSIVPIWGKATLRITEEARAVLLEMMGQISEFRPIVCLTWWADAMETHGEEITHRGPHWGVGCYSSDQVPAESITEIAGIPFIFSAPDALRLEGATLRVSGKGFEVDERAI